MGEEVASPVFEDNRLNRKIEEIYKKHGLTIQQGRTLLRAYFKQVAKIIHNQTNFDMLETVNINYFGTFAKGRENTGRRIMKAYEEKKKEREKKEKLKQLNNK